MRAMTRKILNVPCRLWSPHVWRRHRRPGHDVAAGGCGRERADADHARTSGTPSPPGVPTRTAAHPRFADSSRRRLLVPHTRVACLLPDDVGLADGESESRRRVGAGRRGRGPAPAAGGAPASAAAPPAATAPPARGPAPQDEGGPRLMSDLSYAERPNTHRIRNDGPGLFRAMVVVNETAGGDEAVTRGAGRVHRQANLQQHVVPRLSHHPGAG